MTKPRIWFDTVMRDWLVWQPLEGFDERRDAAARHRALRARRPSSTARPRRCCSTHSTSSTKVSDSLGGVIAAASARRLNTVAVVFGALLVRRADRRPRPPQLPLAHRGLRRGRLRAGRRRPRGARLRSGSGFVGGLAIVALIVILFRDGLEVEAEMLQTRVAPAVPQAGARRCRSRRARGLAAKALTDLTWTECFLLGALLSPTDPVLSSSVVTNPRVPRVIRHSLNLESGLNDGLALPAVLAFAAALDPSDGDFVWWKFVLQDVSLGLVDRAGGRLRGVAAMPRSRRRATRYPAHQKALFALGVAFAAYGIAVLPPTATG